MKKGRGFFCRSLSASDILDLYQAREAIECKLMKLVCKREQREGVETPRESLLASENLYNEDADCSELVMIDERFHIELATMAQNKELLRMLENINERIRFIRTVDLEDKRVVTPQNHMEIVEAMLAAECDLACEKMRSHIERSREQTTTAVRKAYAHIYVPQ